MPMELMIDQLEKNTEIDEMIDKARTYGVHINKHGFSDAFRKKIRSYKHRIDEYNHQIRMNEEELGEYQMNLNIENTSKKHKQKKFDHHQKSISKSPKALREQKAFSRNKASVSFAPGDSIP